MSRKLTSRLLLTALALAVVPLPLATSAPPASAQVLLTVNFGYFHAELAPYGRWLYHPRWGDVWVPREVGFRPYYRRGHWVYTDAGWVWESDYRWGNIAFHYGRWVFDPGYGWVWVPGYVWGPSWVVWYQGDGYVGWAPMPPDDAFLAGEEIYPTVAFDYGRGFGYLDWYGPSYGSSWLAASAFTFVPEAHFADRNFSAYVADPPQAQQLIGRMRNVTNFATVNDRVVGRSIDPAAIQRASGHQSTQVPLRTALHGNAPIDPVSTGRRVQATEAARHGGDPRAPANAKAVPLNAAAAQRGGRNVFGNRQAAGAGAPVHGAAQVQGNHVANARQGRQGQARAASGGDAAWPRGSNDAPGECRACRDHRRCAGGALCRCRPAAWRRRGAWRICGPDASSAFRRPRGVCAAGASGASGRTAGRTGPGDGVWWRAAARNGRAGRIRWWPAWRIRWRPAWRIWRWTGAAGRIGWRRTAWWRWRWAALWRRWTAGRFRRTAGTRRRWRWATLWRRWTSRWGWGWPSRWRRWWPALWRRWRRWPSGWRWPRWWRRQARQRLTRASEVRSRKPEIRSSDFRLLVFVRLCSSPGRAIAGWTQPFLEILFAEFGNPARYSAFDALVARGTAMIVSSAYRLEAEHAVQQSRLAKDEEAKTAWLLIASEWLKLITEIEKALPFGE